MEERIRPSRSGLIAIEVMVAVGVFALCAAIAIGLLVRAELMSRESAELTQAVSQARSAAECYKSAGGDLEKTARLLDARAGEDGLLLCYDSGWSPCPEGEKAVYALTMVPADTTDASGVREAALTVSDGEGATLLTWTVAAWEGTR